MPSACTVGGWSSSRSPVGSSASGAGRVVTDSLREALRWLWWGLWYLLAVTLALILIVGALPVSPWLRWAMLGVVLWALAVDARAKWTGEQT